jgi:methylthioribose-1-phosphate isomerase
MTDPGPVPRSIEWIGGLDGAARLIDQTCLPAALSYIDCRDVPTMREAIASLRVRGAPAIGIAGAMGAVLGIRDEHEEDRVAFLNQLDRVCAELASARPTAVNLSWALDRMRTRARALVGYGVPALKKALLEEARRIRDEDAAMCRNIGRHGEGLIGPGTAVLTHCNAGALATAEHGTALAPMYAAHAQGRAFRVYATETRPLLQGARLTAWELGQAGIDVTLICDSAVGAVMKRGLVDVVITGADRIAANGDVANKIGTYSVAVLAQQHGVPFYVAAPSSTFDLSTPTGSTIPIEERHPDEIRFYSGKPTAPAGISCHNPAFDVTPAALVTGFITETGLIRPVTKEDIARALGRSRAG